MGDAICELAIGAKTLMPSFLISIISEPAAGCWLGTCVAETGLGVGEGDGKVILPVGSGSKSVICCFAVWLL